MPADLLNFPHFRKGDILVAKGSRKPHLAKDSLQVLAAATQGFLPCYDFGRGVVAFFSPRFVARHYDRTCMRLVK